MSETKQVFEIVQTESLPPRTYQKVSRYDEIIDAFVKLNIPTGEIKYEEGEKSGLPKPMYLCGRINKRIRARVKKVEDNPSDKVLETVRARVVNLKCYLERELKVAPKKKDK